MVPLKQRRSRVVYVAGSARELSTDVQEWLSQADNRALASPHIYDTLALLAKGRQPDAVIVSMDAVDWGEMDFFDQLARLHGDTRVYVAGHEHHEDKIIAACQRGARRFAADDLTSFLADVSQAESVSFVKARPAESAPPVRLSAESSGPAESRVTLQPVRAKKRSPAGSDLVAGSFRPMPCSPAVAARFGGETAQPDDSLVARKVSALPGEPGDRDPGDSVKSDDSHEPDQAPPIRLVSPEKPAADLAEEGVSEIAFPWSPSPQRPKRTPPTKAGPDQDEFMVQETPTAARLGPARKLDPPTVELTQEELAALMAGPATKNADATQEPRPGRILGPEEATGP